MATEQEINNKMKMTIDDYLKNRVDDQINWHNTKAKSNKKWYQWLKIIIIIFSATIPIVALVGQNEVMKYIVAGLGALVAILESILVLKKYQENWTNYRVTAERLNTEKIAFNCGVGSYEDASDEVNFKHFVVNIEGILQKQNENWLSVFNKNEKEKF